MNRLLVLALLSTLYCMQFVYGTDPVVEPDVEYEESYEIIQGNCTNALARDMIFHDHVHLSYIPFIKRNATSEWHGDETIYCLKVLNEKDESQGSTTFVKDGGLGHSYITIEMHSTAGHGLEFDIQIYASLK